MLFTGGERYMAWTTCAILPIRASPSASRPPDGTHPFTGRSTNRVSSRITIDRNLVGMSPFGGPGYNGDSTRCRFAAIHAEDHRVCSDDDKSSRRQQRRHNVDDWSVIRNRTNCLTMRSIVSTVNAFKRSTAGITADVATQTVPFEPLCDGLFDLLRRNPDDDAFLFGGRTGDRLRELSCGATDSALRCGDDLIVPKQLDRLRSDDHLR